MQAMVAREKRIATGWLGRSSVVYGVLLCAWVALVAWQGWEHLRVREAAREALADQARDRAAALGVVMRSQGRFGVIQQSKLEAALNELVDSSEILGVALLNVDGEVTAKAGDDGLDAYADLLTQQAHWHDGTATFVNLVSLGPNTGGLPGAVVIPADEERTFRDGPHGEGRRPGRRGGGGPRGGEHGGPFGPRGEGRMGPSPWEEMMGDGQREVMDALTDGTPVTLEEVNRFIEHLPDFLRDPDREDTLREALVGEPFSHDVVGEILRPRGGPGRGAGNGPPPFRRPPWLGPGEYDRLIAGRGVHWFVVTLPDTPFVTEAQRDLRARFIVAVVALLACGALVMAWRAVGRTGALELELVRAEENARHLRELNMAAAGLVHETKNPLNLIRGMAQMIARATDTPDPTRDRAVKITDEADRVTGRLNQFLNYARPPAPTLRFVDLSGLAREVCDILATDAEDRAIALHAEGAALAVEADAGMLRQVLFNLIMNALQAAPEGGRVCVATQAARGGRAVLEVRDNGPGVPPDQREEVFRPYVTGTPDGTGLGLAVVRQIVSAHGWAIQCREAPEGGACFCVTGISLAQERVDP